MTDQEKTVLAERLTESHYIALSYYPEYDRPYVVESAPRWKDGTWAAEELTSVGGWPGAHDAQFDNEQDAHGAFDALLLIDEYADELDLFELWIDQSNTNWPNLEALNE